MFHKSIVKILMRNTIICALVSLTLLISCSDDDSTGPDTSTNVAIRTVMPSPVVRSTAIQDKGTRDVILNGAGIDSISVDRVRLLISSLKVTGVFLGDSTNFMEPDIKTEPVVLTVDTTTGGQPLLEATIPPGEYEKVKFEFHRFSSSELGEFAGDPTFGDFATSDRKSSIMEGRIYCGGVAEAFVFSGDATANLSVFFDSNIQVDEVDISELILEFDPSVLFVDSKSGDLIDPRDSSNENDIENNLKDAIRAYKR